MKKLLSTAPITGRLALVALFLLAAGVSPRSRQIERWMHTGDQTAHEKNYDLAFGSYDRLLSAVGPQPVVYDRLVQMSLAAGHYDDAYVYLLTLADLIGWNPERRSLLAGLLERQGDSDQAAALLSALPDQEQSPRMLRRLVDQQIAQLDWERAEKTLTRLVELEPDNAQSLYQLGLLLAPQNQDYATSFLTRAAADPDWGAKAQTVLAALEAYHTDSLTIAHTRLGIALVGLGEWPFAERVMQMALEANAVNPTARAYLGFVRDQQKRDGLPDIQAALAMSPNDPVIYYLLGQHWRQQRDFNAANQAFIQAYWLAPDNPALAAEVGASWQDLRDMAQAEKWFQTAVDLAPSDLRWKRLLAAFYADTGYELESRGRAFVEQTSPLGPNDPDLRASLGWVYYLSGDTQRAYDELNAAIGLDPLHVRSRYYFAAVLERRGDKQGAADSYWFVVQTVGQDSGFGILAARALQRLEMSP